MPPNLDASWFVETSRPDAYRRPATTFDMTRDGLTLLVMGYTGAKAMNFKVRYIKAFNDMEAELRRQAEGDPKLPDFSDPGEAAGTTKRPLTFSEFPQPPAGQSRRTDF